MLFQDTHALRAPSMPPPRPLACESLGLFLLLRPEFFFQQSLLVLEGGGGGSMLNRLVSNEL